jgi:hypothetical protein
MLAACGHPVRHTHRFERVRVADPSDEHHDGQPAGCGERPAHAVAERIRQSLAEPVRWDQSVCTGQPIS